MGKPDGFVDTVYWTYKQVLKILKNGTSGGITLGQVISQINSSLIGYATETWVNSQGFITSLAGYVPTSREITIGSTTYDLSANRTFAIPVPSGTVNVVRTVIGPAITTVNSTTPVDVMSVSITPSHANNIIVVMATIVYTHAYGSVSSFGIFKNGVATVSTSGNGNENNMQYTTYFNAFQASDMQSTPLMHTELAGTTSPITYSVAVTNGWGGIPANLYINGRVGDDMNGFSYLTVFEIKQ